jgi:hypothetical protein
MKRTAALLFGLSLLGAVALSAQRPEEHPQSQNRPAPEHGRPPRANQGHIPPPPAHSPRGGKPEAERLDGGRVDNTPHVSHDRWYGHGGADDRRFHLDRPFAHGHFARVGPTNRFQFERVDIATHRLWLVGGSFEVAAWDWGLCADWCWNCADDFVVYDDPDHPGWYLVYNLQTGGYVHAQYLG